MLLNIFKRFKAIVVIITLVQIDTRLLVLTCFILATIIRIIRVLTCIRVFERKTNSIFRKDKRTMEFG
jgi:hypothetical protein